MVVQGPPHAARARTQQRRVRESRDPVAEATGRIERPDDETGPDHRRVSAKHVADGALARGLPRAVVAHHRFAGGILQHRQRRVLVNAG